MNEELYHMEVPMCINHQHTHSNEDYHHVEKIFHMITGGGGLQHGGLNPGRTRQAKNVPSPMLTTGADRRCQPRADSRFMTYPPFRLCEIPVQWVNLPSRMRFVMVGKGIPYPSVGRRGANIPTRNLWGCYYVLWSLLGIRTSCS